MAHSFDLIVIGTGTAAGNIAGKCRKAGWSVAVIDERPFGGTCALRGCDPKKMLRRGPEIVDAARRFAGKGINPEGLQLNWSDLMAFKRSFIDPVPENRERGFVTQGIATFHGTARFTGPNTVSVDGKLLQGRYIAIATGARPRPLGFSGEEHVTLSDAFMEQEHLPRRIVFVGGGYISFEFAHMAARAGAEVTVLTRGERPLKSFDPDLVDRLLERCREAGIAFHAHTRVEGVEKNGKELRVQVSAKDDTQHYEADLVVHGAGRVPAVTRLDLEQAGVRANKQGIEVNEYLQSVTNPAVYAAGDVASTDGPPLTPVSSLEGRIAAKNMLNGNQFRPDYTGVPSVVFTIPALARVGLLEAQAREQELDFIGKFTDMSDWYTVRRVGETHAAAKVLTENGTCHILGAHLLGPESSEVINLFALAMRSRLRVSDLKGLVSTYPSAGSDIGYLV